MGAETGSRLSDMTISDLIEAINELELGGATGDGFTLQEMQDALDITAYRARKYVNALGAEKKLEYVWVKRVDAWGDTYKRKGYRLV